MKTHRIEDTGLCASCSSSVVTWAQAGGGGSPCVGPGHTASASSFYKALVVSYIVVKWVFLFYLAMSVDICPVSLFLFLFLLLCSRPVKAQGQSEIEI